MQYAIKSEFIDLWFCVLYALYYFFIFSSHNVWLYHAYIISRDFRKCFFYNHFHPIRFIVLIAVRNSYTHLKPCTRIHLIFQSMHVINATWSTKKLHYLDIYILVKFCSIYITRQYIILSWNRSHRIRTFNIYSASKDFVELRQAWLSVQAARRNGEG